MDTQKITFSANNQTLTKETGPNEFVSNAVAYVEAEFALGDGWSGYDTITALWSSPYATIATILDSSGACTVPFEMLGYVCNVNVNLVGTVVGEDEITYRLTTEKVSAFVVNKEAEVEGTETAPVTPTQFEQYLEAVKSEVGLPTNEQTEYAVSKWLNEHPEATTTVLDNSLTTAKYQNGSVTTTKLADGSVTTEKVASGAITPGKLDRTYATPADVAAVSERVTENASDISSLDSQFQQFVAPTGEAPNPTEIENARVGADGVTYPNLGTAIRTQVTDLKSELTEDFELYVGAEKGSVYNDVNDLAWITPGDTQFYWLGTVPKDCTLYEYYGKGTVGVVPYLAIVRNNAIVSKVALNANTDGYASTALNIDCLEGDEVFIGGAYGAMALSTDDVSGITIKQFPNANVGDTVNITTVTSTKFRYHLDVKYVVGSLVGVGDEVNLKTKFLYNDANSLEYLTAGDTQFCWIGTVPHDCKLTKYYGKGTSGTMPYIAIVRNNFLIVKEPLNVNTGEYIETELSIPCKTGDEVFVGGAVNAIALSTDTSLGITIRQFPNANVGDYVNISTVTSTKFRYHLYIEYSDSSIQTLERTARTDVIVGAGKDFEKLTDALAYAYDKGNCDVYVQHGYYDIYAELGGASYFDSWAFSDTIKGAGPVLGNGCRYIFAPSAKVVFNYAGSNLQVQSDFSPINIGNGNVEIVGLDLTASNCRYCIHDEMGRAGAYDVRKPVVHIYKDLKLYIDNTANAGTTKRECIGGGLGDGTLIALTDSTFESATPNIPNVYWHNYGGGGVSKIDVARCDFKSGTFEAQYFGSHSDVTECMVNNCKMALEPRVTPATSGSTVINMSINKWNNVVG